jgi:hypothetical protein
MQRSRFDATDDPLHGRQEGRFFHGYYGNYCYLPIYCFCGSVPLWLQLRSSDKGASTGTVEALKKSSRRFRRRAAIEPRIGHLKSDFRLGRNFLKGQFGDAINLLLAAGASNLSLWMRQVLFALVSALQKFAQNPRFCQMPLQA